MEKVWLGVDAGKEFHWAHLLDGSGEKLLSRRVENDEADLLRLIDEALSFAGRSQVLWAIDQPGGLRRCFWRCCGKESRESSTFPASPSIAPVIPTGGSPRLMPATPISSLIRLV